MANELVLAKLYAISLIIFSPLSISAEVTLFSGNNLTKSKIKRQIKS